MFDWVSFNWLTYDLWQSVMMIFIWMQLSSMAANQRGMRRDMRRHIGLVGFPSEEEE